MKPLNRFALPGLVALGLALNATAQPANDPNNAPAAEEQTPANPPDDKPSGYSYKAH